MSVVVVGIDRERAPLGLLERVAVGDESLAKVLAELRDRVPLSEVVVLSTCLRTEIYAVVDRFHLGVERVHEYLADLAGRSVSELSEHLHVLFDDAVTVHLFEVASGLRSAVVGETEVLGQVRRALSVAEAERAAGPVLAGLFRRAVKVGRLVRTETAIARGTTSLSHVALSLAAEHSGGDLAGSSVAVVGAGEIGESLVSALHARHRPAELVVVNRTRGRARTLSEPVGGRAAGLEELPDALRRADVVIVSTAAAVPVLDAELLRPVGEARRDSAPLLVVDLGVPRNVEPAVRQLPGVSLFDMDDLTAHAERALADRRGEMVHASIIVAREIERFREDDRARGAAPLVAALRAHVDELSQAELDRLRARSGALDAAQWDEIESIVRSVLAKVMHQPTVALKEAAGTPRGERLVEALRTLFDI